MGIGNGKLVMGNGEWGIGNGELGMGHGEWGMGHGEAEPPGMYSQAEPGNQVNCQLTTN